MKRRLLIVSNRLPTTITKRKGQLKYTPSAGGLATGMSSFYRSFDSLWIGWPGLVTQSAADRDRITTELLEKHMIPIFLSRDSVEKFYEGFSNRCIWPLFHYFPQYAVFDEKLWESYIRVNRMFCDQVVNAHRPGDLIWIHDYHLLLLPQMIRKKIQQATIGFFLHIPFPSFEIFRGLPWRDSILDGLLGADLIAFHTFDYVRHFMSAVARLQGYETKWNRIAMEDRTSRADCFPMGIDYEKYANAPKTRSVKMQIKKLKQSSNTRILLSVDRLDYSKGITQRLHGFHRFLHENPKYIEKIILILVVVPSRSRVESYRKLKIQVDEMVGRINGEHGRIGWTPIRYLYRSLTFSTLSALYSLADIALVTPFRDGMNLVAKEFIASKTDGTGVLILSEMAGAASELGEAIIINPNDVEDISTALETALSMPREDQIRRNREMQNKIKRYDVKRWAQDFVDKLLETEKNKKDILTRYINTQIRKKILSDYSKANRRLIFLDYDGTLVSFAKTPDAAKPDREIIDILKRLSADPGNEVVIISGRGRETIDKWFGHLDLHLVAEHGAWLRYRGQHWELIEPLNQEWKAEIRPLLEQFRDRTPGALIEEKEFSLVWHYRRADVGLGETRARELAEHLSYLTSSLDLQVLEGSKVIEIKNSGINKGKAALRWLSSKKWDFILAFGDDWTDEDTFQVLPDTAYSIKVGFTASVARHNLKSVKEVRSLVRDLIKEEE